LSGDNVINAREKRRTRSQAQLAVLRMAVQECRHKEVLRLRQGPWKAKPPGH